MATNTLVITEVLDAERKPDGTILYKCNAYLNGQYFSDIWHEVSGAHPEADAVCEAYTGTITDVIEPVDTLLPVIEKREERNRRLASSDWTMLVDSGLSDAKKAEWITYRQALRDLPAQDGFPDVDFPERP